jgi:hypothetical protein
VVETSWLILQANILEGQNIKEEKQNSCLKKDSQSIMQNKIMPFSVICLTITQQE